VSPYGFPLGITYPKRSVAALIGAAQRAGIAWAAASVEALSLIHISEPTRH